MLSAEGKLEFPESIPSHSLPDTDTLNLSIISKTLQAVESPFKRHSSQVSYC